jgi:ribosomal protein S19|tara:strand:- start:3111 stop:3482 length:372 start_codon:yes stop_codon:yes gene_type:complete
MARSLRKGPFVCPSLNMLGKKVCGAKPLQSFVPKTSKDLSFQPLDPGKKEENILTENPLSLKPLYSYARHSVILPQWVGLNLYVHNGLTFVRLVIQPEIVGHKLGEFAPTRKQNVFIAKGKRK